MKNFQNFTAIGAGLGASLGAINANSASDVAFLVGVGFAIGAALAGIISMSRRRHDQSDF